MKPNKLKMWSDYTEAKTLMEGWRGFIEESRSINNAARGIYSNDASSDSLKILLKQVDFLEDSQKEQLLNLIRDLANSENIYLESSLQGFKQERERVFDEDTTSKLHDLISSFELESENKESLINILNKWAVLNTIKFSATSPTKSATTTAKTSEKIPAKTSVDGEISTTGSPAPSTPEPVDKKDPYNDFCDELFLELEKDPAIARILGKAEDEKSLRGHLRRLARDLALSIDVTVVSLWSASLVLGGALATIPGAGWVADIIIAVLEGIAGTIALGASAVSSLIACAISISLGDLKGAALDLVSALPLGEVFRYGGKFFDDLAVKATERGLTKVATALSKVGAATAKGTKALAEAEGKLAGKLAKMGVEKEAADIIAKALVKSAKGRINVIIANMNIKLPRREDFEEGPQGDLEYKEKLRELNDHIKDEAFAKMQECVAGSDTKIMETAKSFVNYLDDFVNDIPNAVGWAIDSALDTGFALKDLILPSNITMPPDGSVDEHTLNLNEQRYTMLIKRFKIK